ncbi:MAG: histone deacetylase, partial [Myxococcota bacterium]
MATLLLSGPLFLAHDPGPMHPESPARLRCILEGLARSPVENTFRTPPRPATREELIAVHTSAYVDRLAALAGTST